MLAGSGAARPCGFSTGEGAAAGKGTDQRLALTSDTTSITLGYFCDDVCRGPSGAESVVHQNKREVYHAGPRETGII